ncbi:MAG TPA: BlaI/MecI/CopY family transcriptional regulator [Candidatus Agrococcus pullicola]|uniref:BlaI/MecI/CopY family transcriptional regulator n=1 Tax=Candidatus Agrococcus pullicola TaxID=2838429 RepID=A0A9D2C9R7_9MICO|nr:BlaI/MecI/CopY family transcriptional regulator [Candidatus Agrococcus pullicola]
MTTGVNHAHDDTGGKPVRLGELEAQIMDLLWSGESMTVRDIINRLPGEPAYTTIATVLSNLRKKELVCTGKDGHSTLYGACLTREEHTARAMRHALDASGNRKASILHFVEGMSEADQQLLRDFLLGGE